jgi:hypothetical protein
VAKEKGKEATATLIINIQRMWLGDGAREDGMVGGMVGLERKEPPKA